MIDHGGGWETQYCHLARGSVRVKSGERVTAGQPLGRVGMSGAAEFPHVHFTVRHENKVVDPFAHKPDPATCGSGTSLWAETLREQLSYRARTVLKHGFAPEPVTQEAIDAGTAGQAAIGPDSPALVAFVRAIGLKTGDVQRLVVKTPGGQTVADNTAEPLDRNKAQVMLYSGRKRPATGWPAGPVPRRLFGRARRRRSCWNRTFPSRSRRDAEGYLLFVTCLRTRRFGAKVPARAEPIDRWCKRHPCAADKSWSPAPTASSARISPRCWSRDGAHVRALAHYNSFNDWGWLEDVAVPRPPRDRAPATSAIRHFVRDAGRRDATPCSTSRR